MKIAFIGGGNMGTAIFSALLDKGLAGSEDITVSDIIEERLDSAGNTSGFERENNRRPAGNIHYGRRKNKDPC
jgi:pyrroline-5-carboxylate reductase